MNTEKKKNEATVLTHEELEDLYNERVSMGVIFLGNLGTFSKILKFIQENDCHIVYRKTSRQKLVVSVEDGGLNETN